jgi:hypothetical protein
MKKFFQRIHKMLAGSIYTRAQRRFYYAQAIEVIKAVKINSLTKYDIGLCNVFRKQYGIELCSMLNEFPEIKNNALR